MIFTISTDTSDTFSDEMSFSNGFIVSREIAPAYWRLGEPDGRVVLQFVARTSVPVLTTMVHVIV